VKLYTKLRSLMLPRNNLTEVPWLPSTLESLNLSHNKIKKIEGLGGLTNLLNLDMSYNEISLIDGLMEQHLLEALDLSYNKITVVTNLGHLQALHSLKLVHNQIPAVNAISSLKVNPRLERLWLRENPIMDSSEDIKDSVLTTLLGLKFLDGDLEADRRALEQKGGVVDLEKTIELNNNDGDEDRTDGYARMMDIPKLDVGIVRRKKSGGGKKSSRGKALPPLRSTASPRISKTKSGRAKRATNNTRSAPKKRSSNVGGSSRIGRRTTKSTTKARRFGKSKSVFNRLSKSTTLSTRAKKEHAYMKRQSVEKKKKESWQNRFAFGPPPTANKTRAIRIPSARKYTRTTPLSNSYTPDFVPGKKGQYNNKNKGPPKPMSPKSAAISFWNSRKTAAPNRGGAKSTSPTYLGGAVRIPLPGTAGIKKSVRHVSPRKLREAASSSNEWKENPKSMSGNPRKKALDNTWVDELDLSSQKGIKRIIKNLNEKINKLYNWHLVEIDLVAKQQLQLNTMKAELDTARRKLGGQEKDGGGSLGAVTSSSTYLHTPGATTTERERKSPYNANEDDSKSRRNKSDIKGGGAAADLVLDSFGPPPQPPPQNEASKTSQTDFLEDDPNAPEISVNSVSVEESKQPPLELPPAVDKWARALVDEIETSRMSLQHLITLSSYKGSDFPGKLRDLKKVFDHCDVMQQYRLIEPVQRFLTEHSEYMRNYVTRCLQRLSSTKTTLQTFYSLMEEVGPKSQYVSQIRTKILSSGLLNESRSPYDVLTRRTVAKIRPAESNSEVIGSS